MRLTSLVAIVVTAVLCLSRPVGAQGTSDLFPEPMTSAEAEASIDRMGLTGDAKIESLKAFEAYVERFVALRKGDIDEYLKSRTEMGTTPAREEIAKRVDQHRAILKKIAGIENELFDRFVGVAGEANATRVARERNRAERRRDWAASNPFMGRSGRIELADLVNDAMGDAKLSDDALKAVDGALKSYESQATSLTHKLVELAVQEPLAMADARAAAGIAQPPRAEGDGSSNAWRDYFDALDKVRTAAREPQTEVRGKIRANTRTQAKAIGTALPADVAAKFRQSFVERAYGSIAQPRDPVPGLLKDAKNKLENGELTKDELSAVEAIAAAHAARRADLNEKLMSEADKESLRDAGMPLVFRMGGSDQEEPKSDLEKLADERSKLDDATVAAIGGAAPVLAKKNDGDARHEEGGININGMHLEMPEIMDAAGGSAVVVMAGDAIGGGDGVAVMSFAVAGAGPALGTPAPLNREDVDGLREQFKLSGNDSTVLDLLFEDYQSKWQELEQGELAELKSVPNTGPGFDGPNPAVPTERDVAREFELRRIILDRAIALEHEFSGSLGAALSTRVSKEAAQRWERSRDRAAYLGASEGQGGFMMLAMGESKAASLDLAAIVRGCKFAPESLAAVQPMLETWESTSVDALRNRFETHFAAQRARSDMDRKLAVQAAAEGRSGELRLTSENPDIQKVNAAEERAGSADKTVEATNRQALDAMLAALPDDASRGTLREAWNRKAWPSVYRDRRDVEPLITKALSLQDLAPEAKLKLDGIAVEHRLEYLRICHEMIEASEKSVANKKEKIQGAPAIDFQAVQARQDAMKRLRFERDELNAKTLRRVKEILTPAQAAKIGDLPKEQRTIQFGPGV